jgi:hypothetical protein
VKTIIAFLVFYILVWVLPKSQFYIVLQVKVISQLKQDTPGGQIAHSGFFLLFLFGRRFCYVAQTDLELVILLPQPCSAGITGMHHHIWL